MDLTWRDLVSTVALGLMLIGYTVYLTGGVSLISSTWATAAVLLIVGIGGRVIGTGGGKAPSQELFPRVLRVVGGVIGVVALLAGLSAVLVGSAYALKIFVMSSIVVWAATVLSHV